MPFKTRRLELLFKCVCLARVINAFKTGLKKAQVVAILHHPSIFIYLRIVRADVTKFKADFIQFKLMNGFSDKTLFIAKSPCLEISELNEFCRG